MDSILSGRWKVYYEAENRQKRVYRDTSVEPTVTDTTNELYSALQDLFDELNQMDDGVPMSAQTPTEYTIGIIDAGDDDPWFIDRTSAEYLTGGAIKTASWNRVEGSNTGIVKITCDNTNIVAGDIGEDIVHDNGDTGTLLDVKGTGADSILWVRPDSSVEGNSFPDSSGTLTCNTHTATQSSASESGESLWANTYSLGTIEANTHLYVYQNANYLTKFKDATKDWWGAGHIDVLICVKEVGLEIDEGVIKVLGRQYSKGYDYYEVDLSAGGRNPIPLATGDDLNNESGYHQMVLTDASGTFTVGEIIEDDTDNSIQGVVTSTSGTAPDITLQYYLVGNPITDFSVSTGGFTGQSSTHTATAVDPTDVNPAGLVGLSITHSANETFDIDEDGTTENYSIVIDCSDESVADVFEWCKYITRRGDTGTGDTDGQKAEEYVGSDYRIVYTSLTGTISEGDVVTQQTSNATGTVVAHNTTDKILVLRSSRGAFNNTNQIDGGSGDYVTGVTCTALSPIKACPYGTFAGGKFFCAPGVVLDNVPTADANNYQLTDDSGNVVEAPTKVTVLIGNTREGDRIAVFRLTGAGENIKKDDYTCTVQSQGDNTVVVAESIDPETVGKSTGGILRIVDADADKEYRLRYSSWSGSTFTLASTEDDAMESGTDTDTIVATGAFTNSQVGDLIYNNTRTAYAYITSITSNDEVEIAPAITGQTTGDTFDINTLPVATTTSDKVYCPFIDVYETTGTVGTPGSESVSVTYSIDIPVRVRARQAGDIVPYEADSTIKDVGLSMNVIRTADAIYT